MDDLKLTSGLGPGEKRQKVAGGQVEPVQASGGKPMALTFDPDEFISHIADLELTEDQATELLGAIWSIMVAFVDLGFGIHPVQQAQSARNGDVGKNLAALDQESALVVSCRGNFNAVLHDNAGPRRKGRRAARTDS
jgi:hypothetical protein